MDGESVRRDPDIGRTDIARLAFLHQLCDIGDIHVAVQQRPVGEKMEAVVDGFRGRGQPHDDSAGPHGLDVLRPQGDTAAAGDDKLLPLAERKQRVALQVPEICFAVVPEHVADAHAHPVHDHLVSVYVLHLQHAAQVVSHGGLAAAHKADQHDVVGEETSGLDLPAAFYDLLIDIEDLILILMTGDPLPQDFSLFFLLVSLKDDHAVFFFIPDDLLDTVHASGQRVRDRQVNGGDPVPDPLQSGFVFVLVCRKFVPDIFIHTGVSHDAFML